MGNAAELCAAECKISREDQDAYACMELGTGIASITSGMIVSQGLNGRIEHFNYVGYVSVAVGLLSIYVASKVKVVSKL